MHPSLVGIRDNPPDTIHGYAICCGSKPFQVHEGGVIVAACAKWDGHAIDGSCDVVAFMPCRSLGREARKPALGSTLLQFDIGGFWHGLTIPGGRHSGQTH